MVVLRWIFGLLTTLTAALVGNWVGGQIHLLLTGHPTHTIHFEYTTSSGLKMDNYPVNTKFYPALLFALLGRPRWVFALLGGTLTGLLVNDRYEEIWLERVIVPLIVARIPRQNASSRKMEAT